MKIKKNVVFITGSSSGIGAATAKLFAKNKFNVVVNCLENEEGAKLIVEECKMSGVESFYVKGDVSDSKTVEKIFQQIEDKYGKLDVLINNAGSTDKKPYLQSDVKDWIDVFNNNLFGTMLCSQFAAKLMLKQGYGKILNTASIRGLEHGGREGIMAYSAAKASVISFTKTLAKLLAPKIQVNAIAPGFVWTPNYESVDESLRKEFIDGSLLKRWINVDEIAHGYKYLAETDAVTGEVLTIDAGWNLKF